ncbi:hypothetical protein WJ978_28195 [Achromobacter xylosoxidans]
MGGSAGRARAGQSALLPGTGGVSIWGLQLAKASGRHFGKIVIRVDAWTARSRW